MQISLAYIKITKICDINKIIIVSLNTTSLTIIRKKNNGNNMK